MTKCRFSERAHSPLGCSVRLQLAMCVAYRLPGLFNLALCCGDVRPGGDK